MRIVIKKTFKIIGLVVVFFLLIASILSLLLYTKKKYGKLVEGKDISQITCVYYRKNQETGKEEQVKGIIKKDKYGELVQILNNQYYRLHFTSNKGAVVDYLEIEFVDGYTIVLNRYYIKSKTVNGRYLIDSTFEITPFIPLVDESTIIPVSNMGY